MADREILEALVLSYIDFVPQADNPSNADGLAPQKGRCAQGDNHD
jgi:hypothetical protein